jgi:hypothetical protein
MKKALSEGGVDYTEHSLTQAAGKAKVREFMAHVRRDASGGIILPILIAHTQGIVRSVMNTAEEYEAWSKSKV